MAEWDEDAWARLRAAAHRGIGDAEVLRGRPLGPVLQYAGDVLLAALTQGGEVRELARECVAELRGRDLPGDAELAAELGAALGMCQAPERAPLPVDLGAVAAAMDDAFRDAGLHVVDLECGDVLPADEGNGLPIPPADLPENEELRRGAAREWLAEQGYRPVPRSL
ncbi:hypothetical protein E1293_42310 [Actinomadura darangshiensis]|uniref:Uncharacterized protein n=1 Tax=Actinomadura darangshiensis TaxID=705336 RepID=A0A4R4ZX42_9ACTN|nr:hypothetical protein [Actinomadura darangshiensis]TDD63878.1 hypothetical protein E1293_42310 [Actinomadura darangshiensis]